MTRDSKKLRETTRDRHLKWIDYYSSMDFGLWIECIKCKKWRRNLEYSESHEVPENWCCSMNASGKCEDPEEESEEEFIEYSPGSIVWARVVGYPWWPGMVDEDPDVEEFYFKEKKDDFYNVTFLDERVTRAWVSARNICPFLNHSPRNSRMLQKCPRGKYSSLILKAEERAKAALEMSLKDRLQKFSFVHLYKGKWPTADNFDEDKDPLNVTDVLLEEIDDLESIHSLDSDESDKFKAQERDLQKGSTFPDTSIANTADSNVEPSPSKMEKSSAKASPAKANLSEVQKTEIVTNFINNVDEHDATQTSHKKNSQILKRSKNSGNPKKKIKLAISSHKNESYVSESKDDTITNDASSRNSINTGIDPNSKATQIQKDKDRKVSSNKDETSNNLTSPVQYKDEISAVKDDNAKNLKNEQKETCTTNIFKKRKKESKQNVTFSKPFADDNAKDLNRLNGPNASHNKRKDFVSSNNMLFKDKTVMDMQSENNKSKKAKVNSKLKVSNKGSAIPLSKELDSNFIHNINMSIESVINSEEVTEIVQHVNQKKNVSKVFKPVVKENSSELMSNASKQTLLTKKGLVSSFSDRICNNSDKVSNNMMIKEIHKVTDSPIPLSNSNTDTNNKRKPTFNCHKQSSKEVKNTVQESVKNPKQIYKSNVIPKSNNHPQKCVAISKCLSKEETLLEDEKKNLKLPDAVTITICNQVRNATDFAQSSLSKDSDNQASNHSICNGSENAVSDLPNFKINFDRNEKILLNEKCSKQVPNETESFQMNESSAEGYSKSDTKKVAKILNKFKNTNAVNHTVNKKFNSFLPKSKRSKDFEAEMKKDVILCKESQGSIITNNRIKNIKHCEVMNGNSKEDCDLNSSCKLENSDSNFFYVSLSDEEDDKKEI